MKTFGSGAKSSELKPRYDLLEVCALRRWALRMQWEPGSHGERNYQNGAGDAEFIRDRINHFLEHAHKYAAGDRSDDHLGAIMANAGMLILVWTNTRSRHAPAELHGDPARDLAGVVDGA